jgi:hypothetical protein
MEFTQPNNTVRVVYYAANTSGMPINEDGVQLPPDSEGVVDSASNILGPDAIVLFDGFVDRNSDIIIAPETSSDIVLSSGNHAITVVEGVLKDGLLFDRVDESGAFRIFDIATGIYAGNLGNTIHFTIAPSGVNRFIIFVGFLPAVQLVVLDKYDEGVPEDRFVESPSVGIPVGPFYKNEIDEYVFTEVVVTYTNYLGQPFGSITAVDDMVSGTMPISNVTITYHYLLPGEVLDEFEVSYLIEGAYPPAADGMPTTPQSHEEGSPVTVAADPTSTLTEKDGVPGTWTFDGWTSQSVVITGAGDTFIMPSNDVIIVGTWTFTPDEIVDPEPEPEPEAPDPGKPVQPPGTGDSVQFAWILLSSVIGLSSVTAYAGTDLCIRKR